MSRLLQDVRIARVSTIPFFVITQLRSQLESLSAIGAEVAIVTSHGELSEQLGSIKKCTFHPIPICREISLWTDFFSLIKLWRLFRQQRFSIVHSTTPKAGLLCAIAAKLAGINVCVHTYTGQTWVTMRGIKKHLTKWSDKLIARLNVCCYTDSLSQRDFLIRHKIVAPEKLKVIGSGSLAGVDTQRFCAERFPSAAKHQLKIKWGISAATNVLLFIGRITREKGIWELLEALHQLIEQGHDVVLIAVGPFEQRNEQGIRDYAKKHCANRVIFTGYHAEPECFIAISDLLCLPSYREGFGTVVIEAAAMGVPAVGTQIYGLSDAIVDQSTGLLVEPQNSSQLMAAINTLLTDESLRRHMGEQAKKRALNDFDSTHCSALLAQEYIQLLARRS